MPSSLLNGGIKRLIENVHLQSSLAASDAEATKFLKMATVVLDEYYSAVLRDLDYLFDSAVNGVEIVDWSRDAQCGSMVGADLEGMLVAEVPALESAGHSYSG